MKFAMIFFGFAFIVLSTIGLVFTIPQADYSGKLVFNTEQDYSTFKTAVGAEGVKINSLNELSSAPPIIVQFDVSVPRDAYFPYGNRQDGTVTIVLMSIVEVLGVGSIIGGILTKD